jgi:hypothetical protein
MRAAQLHVPRKQQAWRDFAKSGFRRRKNCWSPRGIAGAHLRRRLHARGGLFGQAKHLINILRQFHTLAVELAARRRLGLTRLSPIIIAASQSERVAILCGSAPAAIDSS